MDVADSFVTILDQVGEDDGGETQERGDDDDQDDGKHRGPLSHLPLQWLHHNNISLNSKSQEEEHGGGDGEVGHEVGGVAEESAEDPVLGDDVEEVGGAVEQAHHEVCHRETANEVVGNGSHTGMTKNDPKQDEVCRD